MNQSRPRRPDRWRVRPLAAPGRWGVRLAGLLSLTLVAWLAVAPGAAHATGLSTIEIGGSGNRTLDADLEQAFKAAPAELQDFWVSFTTGAQTGAAADIEDWRQRGEYVVDRLRQAAESSQAGTVAALDAAGVGYTAYWITNAIRVHGGDYGLARQLAEAPGVAAVFAPIEYEQPKLVDGQPTGDRAEATESVIEWGVRNVRADQIWRDHAVRGDGIVVANIDSGVQFDHPALVHSYRGNNGDGTLNHDYHWLDVTGESPYPFDWHGHGTHTMGTVVGDDGATNQIGVAPGATWIAANGCCPSDDALLTSAQWMLAPTKLDGSDPRPELRPHIVNNSWGSTVPATDPFMPDILQAWADAGIFGVWANGNHGPACQTSGSPGSRTLNYSVGSYDINNRIAETSSRGPGQDGEIKPNISAPGVDVRSAYPSGRYALISGTSMATPHVTGAVALLWAADPSLIGDLAATRALLDQTAIDTPDDQCGGTPENNNVYGQGRLDATALIESTEPGPTGTITGTVTAAQTGEPVTGASITLTRDSLIRSTRTDTAGGYTAGIAAGDYTATVTAFGFVPTTVPISVTAGEATTTDIALPAMEGFDVSGRVLDGAGEQPIAGARVTLAGTLFTAETDPDGRFTVADVPGPATYVATVDGGGCNRAEQLSVDVEQDLTLPDIALDRRLDEPHQSSMPWGWGPPYGYSCVVEPSQWIEADTPIEMPGPQATIPVDLPFPVTYYGREYQTIYLAPQTGRAGFEMDGRGDLVKVVAVFEDALRLPEDRPALLSRITGTAPNRAFTIEWREVGIASGLELAGEISFQITLREDGDIVYAYHDIDPDNFREAGNGANVALGSHTPDGRSLIRTSLIYSSWEPVLRNERQIRFTLPPNGFVNGTVRDEATGEPVGDATVDLYNDAGDRLVQVHTDDAGSYRLQLFTGQDYLISAYAPPGYPEQATTTVRLNDHREQRQLSLPLAAADVSITPGDITLTQGGPDRYRNLITIENTGPASYDWRASSHLPRPDAPEPGSLLGSASTVAHVGQTNGVVEVDGDWWVSGFRHGMPIPGTIIQLTPDGQPTGERIDIAALASDLGVPAESINPRDMTWLPERGWLCLFTHFTDADEVVCVDPEEPGVAATIPTGYGAMIGSAGLSYDSETDRFFVLVRPTDGGYQRQLRTLAGVDHPRPGEELNTCLLAHQGGGLAFNPTSRTLWTSTLPGMHTTLPVMRQVDPVTCAVISSTELSYTLFGAGAPAHGLSLDPGGNLVVPHVFGAVSVMAADDPIADDPPWLVMTDRSGSISPQASGQLRVGIDWTRVPAGATEVTVVLRGNAGASPAIEIPVRLQR